MVKTLSSGNTAKLRLFQAGTETQDVCIFGRLMSAQGRNVSGATVILSYMLQVKTYVPCVNVQSW